jgi:hypothetical protein
MTVICARDSCSVLQNPVNLRTVRTASLYKTQLSFSNGLPNILNFSSSTSKKVKLPPTSLFSWSSKIGTFTNSNFELPREVENKLPAYAIHYIEKWFVLIFPFLSQPTMPPHARPSTCVAFSSLPVCSRQNQGAAPRWTLKSASSPPYKVHASSTFSPSLTRALRTVRCLLCI